LFVCSTDSKTTYTPFRFATLRKHRVHEMRVGRNPFKKRRTNPHCASTYEAFKFVLFLRVEYVQFGIELRFVGKGTLCLEKISSTLYQQQ